MRHFVARVLVTLSLATLLMCFAIGQVVAAEPSSELPLGTWKLVKRGEGGKEDMPKAALQMVITEKSMSFFLDEKADKVATVVFDPKSSPRTMDYRFGTATPTNAIWEIKEGKLRMCQAFLSKDGRPAGFDERRFPLRILEFEKVPEGEDLFYPLPEDEAWVRYEVESRQGDAALPKGLITISSVGTEQAQGELCRWVEVAIKQPSPLQGNRPVITLVFKLLIPEAHLGYQKDPLNHIVRAWRTVISDDGKSANVPVEIFAESGVAMLGPVAIYLHTPYEKVTKLPVAAIDSKVGKFDCVGIEAEAPFPFVPTGRTPPKVLYRLRLNRQVPFGVAALDAERQVEKDGKTSLLKQSLKLVAMGKDAKTLLVLPAVPDDAEAAVRLLAPRAASVRDRQSWTAMDSSEQLAKLEDVTDQPLALLIRKLTLEKEISESQQAEFQWLAKELKFAGQTLAFRPGSASFVSPLQPAYISKVTADVVKDTATGKIAFEAKGLYRGIVEYTAQRRNGKWAIVEFRLPAHKLKTSLNEKDLWKITPLAVEDAGDQTRPTRFAPSADLAKLNLIPEASHSLAIFIEEKFGRPDAPKTWDELPVDFGARDLATGKAAGWKLLAGNTLYNKHCADCHGFSGGGGGPKAAKLEPHPRDFRTGRFKIRSTGTNRDLEFVLKPLRHDLRETLRLGVPGTAMPAFNKLQPDEADALVEYVRWLSIRGEFEALLARFLKEEEASDAADVKRILSENTESISHFTRQWLLAERESSILRPIKRITPDAESLAAGKRLFNDRALACTACHGADGKGRQNFISPPRESSESPVWDLTSGLYRGGIEPDDVFRRLRAGMLGSRMHAYPAKMLSDEDAWHVVNYTLSLASAELRNKQVVRRAPPPGLDDNSPLQVGVKPASPDSNVPWKGWAKLRGRFVFRGQPPATPPLRVSGDVAVCGKQQENESLLIDKDGGTANVVIYLRTKDTPWQEAIKRKNEPAVLSIDKCRFVPHVLPLLVEDGLLIKNSDPIRQHVRMTTIWDAGFSELLPAGGEERPKLRVVHDKPAMLSNSMHPHMMGYLLPRDNPYFAVTGSDGRFEIVNLPAGGPLEFQVWHERAPRGLVTEGWKQGRFTVELVADETKDLGDIKVTPEMLR